MRRVRSWRDALTLIGFLSPALVLLGVFTIWPAVWAVYQSFTNKALTGFEARSPRFVGLQNYARLLDDPGFHSSMLRTFAFVLLSAVVGQTIFAFLIAYLMADRPRWRLSLTPLFAAVFLLPLAVPEAVAALLWASMANGTQEGLLNQGLGLVGLGPVEWLQQHAFETVTVVNIWRGIPFAMVLFAAAIESIPRTTLEAGLIDGASPWQQLRRVVLPILRPQILTFLMLTTITTFGIFGLVFFLTRGGPGNATEIIGIYIYQRAFAFFQIGLGSAAGVLLLLVLLGLGAYYVWLMREQV
ncbi:MAG TPA: sugar ABC transporter permease [Actinomycetes bacterium]|nr:sugar ABC transporter permease [Actinomycetes bacterium]